MLDGKRGKEVRPGDDENGRVTVACAGARRRVDVRVGHEQEGSVRAGARASARAVRRAEELGTCATL